ncbi:hypothetical protein [Escherichia coli]|uniref:hypothetical protein n=1 Tax=Escherichia coli TaxID=562 RepID=UPI0037DC3810
MYDFKLKPKHSALDEIELNNSNPVYCPDTDDDSVYDPDSYLTEYDNYDDGDNEAIIEMKWSTNPSPDDVDDTDDNCGFELEDSSSGESYYDSLWKYTPERPDEENEMTTGTIYDDDSYRDEPEADIPF